ncbi:MAG: YlxR family protein [Clostridia bacterium]
MQTEKKLPQRLCMGCNTPKPKKELIRIVKTKDGEITIDETGKKSGRGAYICKDVKCFNKIKKSKRLEKALKTTISDEIYECLEKSLQSE